MSSNNNNDDFKQILLFPPFQSACSKYTGLCFPNFNNQSVNELTWPAGNQRLFPLAAGQTPDYRVQFLHKTLVTVVPQLGVGLVAQALLPEQLGVGNLRGFVAGR